MTAAMKKKGVGIFAPKKLSDALAAVCGVKTASRTEVTKKIWAYIKKNGLNTGRTIKPDSKLKAIFPLGSPGHSALEFRRRAGLWSRGRKSSCIPRMATSPLPDYVSNFCRCTSHVDGGE